MAAQKLDNFTFERPVPVGRYDWKSWVDGSVWQIERGSDYDVATENMRVNLHTKAKQIDKKVRTSIFRDGDVEGLRFQFYRPEVPEASESFVAASDDEGDEDGGASLEAQWHAEMLDIHAKARAIGYSASRFIQMVNEHGGLVAAKLLINSTQPSDGFTELWERKRLDIAVEAWALKPAYRSLFTQAELVRSRQRLVDYGWTRDRPWEA